MKLHGGQCIAVADIRITTHSAVYDNKAEYALEYATLGYCSTCSMTLVVLGVRNSDPNASLHRVSSAF